MSATSTVKIEGSGASFTASLDQAIQDTSVKKLELAVKAGSNIAKHLREQFQKHEIHNSDSIIVTSFLEEIKNLEEEASNPFKIVFGVYGVTGTGKSSLLNAVIGDENILPTNGMRACTSVVIEVGYNHDDDPDKRYRAEVEFIDETSWENELINLLEDIEDGNTDNAAQEHAPDDAKKVALDKIKAVFPRFRDRTIKREYLDLMMQDLRARNVLGSTKSINAARASTFRNELSQYVDSRGKPSSSSKKTMQYWPLIKVVKIYVKAEALKTGAVLVDLPGVQDANAARSAVASTYMQRCAGLWIVAPIHRAMDDKAALDLLESSLKQQLAMDGLYSNLTFICTKTDDIDVEEIFSSVEDWDDQATNLYSQWTKTRELVDILDHDLKTNTSEADKREKFIIEMIRELRTWTALKHDCEAGLEVQYPSPKRRRTSKAEKQVQREPPTLEEIVVKCAHIQNALDKSKKSKSILQESLFNLKTSLSEAKAKSERLGTQMTSLCITRRNELCQVAIKSRFQQETRRFNQTLAVAERAARISDEAGQLINDEASDELPIFCVSSRGYQQLSRRRSLGVAACVFENKEQTEIPQLRAHCIGLTDTGRIAKYRNILNQLKGLLLSIKLWCDAPLSKRKSKRGFVPEDEIGRLRKTVNNIIAQTQLKLDDNFQSNIFSRLHKAAVLGETKALSIVKEQDDIYWSTFRAMCKRNGVFTNVHNVDFNLNQKIAEPMVKAILNGWRRAFGNEMHRVFRNAATEVMKPIKEASSSLDKKPNRNSKAAEILAKKLAVYNGQYDKLVAEVMGVLEDEKKRIHREMMVPIETHMQPGYAECAEQKGKGTDHRMRAAILKHTKQAKLVMFKEVASDITQALTALLEVAKIDLQMGSESIMDRIERDYWNAIGGKEENTNQRSNAAKDLRTTIKDFLSSFEEAYQQFYAQAQMAGSSSDIIDLRSDRNEEAQGGKPQEQNEEFDPYDYENWEPPSNEDEDSEYLD